MRPKIIIRTSIGSKPLDGGPQLHRFTKMFKEILTELVIYLDNPKKIFSTFKNAIMIKTPSLI